MRKESAAFSLYLFLLIKTFVFIAVIFKVMEASFFSFEGVFSLKKSIIIYFLGILTYTFFLCFYKIVFKKIKAKTIFLEQGLFFGFTTILPFFMFLHKPKKTLSFLWVALEWHKLPLNFYVILKCTYLYFILFILLTLFLLWTSIVKNKKYLVIIVYFIIAGILFYKLFNLGAWQRVEAYFVIFWLPVLLTIWATKKNLIRMLTYLSFYNVFSLTLFLFYVGDLPLKINVNKNLPSGIKVFYPFKNQKANFQIEFLRAMFVDEKRNYLFATYGPTSGIVRLSLNKPEEKILKINSVSRYIWSKENIDEIYAVDWLNAEIIVISKSKFKIIKKVNIFDNKLIMPVYVAVRNNTMYIGSNEYPALTSFNLKTLQKTKQMLFRNLKITPFRSGNCVLALDPNRQQIFVEIGMIDLKNNFALVVVNLKNFKIKKIVKIKEGSIELLAIKEKDSLLVPAFYSEDIAEYSANNLKLKRKIKGPLNTRSIIYDKKRNLLYATSFSLGVLFVIDYASGKTLKKVQLGNKIYTMYLAAKKDLLFIGSAQGIYKINLKEFLSG